MKIWNQKVFSTFVNCHRLILLTFTKLQVPPDVGKHLLSRNNAKVNAEERNAVRKGGGEPRKGGHTTRGPVGHLDLDVAGIEITSREKNNAKKLVDNFNCFECEI